MQSAQSDYDAIIIGARCAGAATAMLLARAGARVLLVERDRPGTDTMSTHALMRGGVFQLAKWGLLPSIIDSGAPPVRRTSFNYGSEAIEVDIRPSHGTDALYAPRRNIIDNILAEAATSAGADLHFETSAVDLLASTSGACTGVVLQEVGGIHREARAPLVIGADGRRSWLARRVDAPVTASATASAGVIYGRVKGQANRGYEWFYASKAAGGIIPTNDGESVVFLALPPDRATLAPAARDIVRFRALIAETLPELATAISRSEFISRPVLFAGEKGFQKTPIGPGWALVGDAGYFKDPLTAHGMTDALRDAELLTDAIFAGRLQDYPQERDTLSHDFFRLTERIASFDWSLEELKDLHIALNKAMKPTQERCSRHLGESRDDIRLSYGCLRFGLDQTAA